MLEGHWLLAQLTASISAQELSEASSGVGLDDLSFWAIRHQSAISRQVSSRANVGAQVSFLSTDYSDDRRFSTVTPQVTANFQISERLSLNGAVGASFSSVDDGISTRHSTGAAANVALCSAGEHSHLCARAAINQSAATVAGPAKNISAGIDYSRQLDAGSSIQLSLDGSHYSSPDVICVRAGLLHLYLLSGRGLLHPPVPTPPFWRRQPRRRANCPKEGQIRTRTFRDRCSSATGLAILLMSEAESLRTDKGPHPAWLVNHLPVILWERRYYVLGCLSDYSLLAGIIAAFALPRTYRSRATLLVQSQDLPTSIVAAPATGAVEQRIARIREQVLSRGDLIQLIEQEDLVLEGPAIRSRSPRSSRRCVTRRAVGALSSDIGQQSGSQNQTIAIAMSFDYPDAVKAQAVLQSYVTKFLSMDSEDVEDQATLTVRFLQDQANKLQSQISEIEGQLTALKARNGAALAAAGLRPSSTPAALALRSLGCRRRIAIDRAEPTTRPAETVLWRRPKRLWRRRKPAYSDSHPDVIAAKERVNALGNVWPPDRALMAAALSKNRSQPTMPLFIN